MAKRVKIEQYIKGFEYTIEKIWEYRLFIPKEDLYDFDELVQSYIDLLTQMKEEEVVFQREHDFILIEARKFLIALDSTYNAGYAY